MSLDNMPIPGETEAGLVTTTRKEDKKIGKIGPDFSKPPCNGGTPNITVIKGYSCPNSNYNICSPQFYTYCQVYQQNHQKK